MLTLIIENRQLIFAALASILTIFVYYPYFKDTFSQKSQPHLYTWVIWAITQVTATLSAFYGGGGFSVFALLVSTILTCSMAICALKYGTKNITRSDTLSLISALSIVPIWWFTQSPYIAVFMAILIDTIGYYPTFRKTWSEPFTETPIFWAGMSVASLLTIFSTLDYNFLTVAYVFMMFLLNAGVYTVCILKRKDYNK